MKFFILSLFILSVSFSLYSHQEETPDRTAFLYEGVSYLGKPLGGSLNNLRLWIKRDKNNSITGVYRYAISKDSLSLSGHFDAQAGIFKLEEKDKTGKVTGQFQLNFPSSSSQLFDTEKLEGKWLSPDGTKSASFFFTKSNWTYLGEWKWLVPQQATYSPTDTCTLSEKWPLFMGFSPQVTLKLRQLLAPKDPFIQGGMPSFCEEQLQPFSDLNSYSMEIDYTLLAYRQQLVSLALTNYSYTGGAHGMTGIICKLFDMTTGNEINISELMDRKASAQLKSILEKGISQILAKEVEAGASSSLEELLKYWAPPETINKMVADPPMICLTPTGAKLQFNEYEVASYSAGLPSIALTDRELQALLIPDNPIVKRLFK